MIALQIQDVKTFMSKLLIHQMFDEFLLNEMDVSMAYNFHIDGSINKEWYSTDEEEELSQRTVAKWKEVKPLAYQLIKGNKTPLYMKIVFQLNREQLGQMLENAHMNLTSDDVNGLFMNIKYDKNTASIITGSSLRLFTLDKTLEHYWDDTVKLLLKKNQIAYTEE